MTGRTTAIEEVYRWSGGGHVSVHSGWSQSTDEETTRFILNPGVDDDWACSLLYSPKNRQMIPFGDGKSLLQIPAEALRRARGFLLDLGIRRPRFGPSLVRRLDREHPYSAVTYPRPVPDEVWEGRYESAERHLFLPAPRPEGSTGQWWQTRATMEDVWLGWIHRLEVYGPERSGHEGLFSALWEQGADTVEALYFPAVVDRVIEAELLLPASSMRAWDAENVVRGEWVLPAPDEVELYRLLGEDLPVLWPYEKLLPWLVERETR